MTAAQQEIISTITDLNERYDITLSEIDKDIDAHRKLVSGFLKEMGVSI